MRLAYLLMTLALAFAAIAMFILSMRTPKPIMTKEAPSGHDAG